MSKPYLINTLQGKAVIRGPEVKNIYQGTAPINVDNTTNLISIDLNNIASQEALNITNTAVATKVGVQQWTEKYTQQDTSIANNNEIGVKNEADIASNLVKINANTNSITDNTTSIEALTTTTTANTAAIATKANTEYLDTELALKANNTDLTPINASIDTINTELPKKENVWKVLLTPNQANNGVLTTQQTFTLPQNVNTLKELIIVVKSSSPLTGLTTIPLIIDRSVYGQTIASGNYLVGFQGTKQVRVVLTSGAGISGVIWIYTDLAIKAILGVEGTPLGA